MDLKLEKPRITEIQVRMDCNGCLQKIKKALYGITGIYDLYIDFPQQKLTVVGWADSEKIIKAIKKARKTATICSHTEASEPDSQPPQAAEGEKPAVEAKDPPTPENPPAEPPKDPPPPPENPAPEVKPSPEATETTPTNPAEPSEPPKDIEQIHIIHHHPGSYICNEHLNAHSIGHGFRHEPPPYDIHSYNTYKPSAYTSEYAYVQSTPHYADDYHSHRNGDRINLTAVFSDENPNACTIA